MANGHGGKRPGAGRPIGAHNKVTADIAVLARSHVPAAVTELARIFAHSVSDTARVAAIKEILDRAYGKSVQAIQGLDEHGDPVAAPSMRVVVQLVGDAPAPRQSERQAGIALSDDVRRNVKLVG